MRETIEYLNVPVELLRNTLDDPEGTLDKIYRYFFIECKDEEDYVYTCNVFWTNQWKWINDEPYDCLMLLINPLSYSDRLQYENECEKACNNCTIREQCREQREKDYCEGCRKYRETHDESWLHDDECFEHCEYEKECEIESDARSIQNQNQLYEQFRKAARKEFCDLKLSGWRVGIAKETLLPNLFDSEKSQWERACLLCYVSLRSILGNQKMCLTNSRLMFARMAGYYAYSDIQFDEIGVIARYFHTERQMSKYSEDLRLDVMEMFNTFHIYSEKGKRGFVVAKSNKKRAVVFKSMKDYLDNSTRDSRRKAIKDLMKSNKAESEQRKKTSMRNILPQNSIQQ